MAKLTIKQKANIELLMTYSSIQAKAMLSDDNDKYFQAKQRIDELLAELGTSVNDVFSSYIKSIK